MRALHQLQTSKKDNHQLTNRRSKAIFELNKKPHKKCPDPGDVAPELPEESFDTISDISEDHQLLETAESIFLETPKLPASSRESIDSSDLTPLSTSTVTKHVIKDIALVESSTISEPANIVSIVGDSSSTSTEMVSLETEILVNHLKQARDQLTNSTKVDFHSKKLVDKLLEVVIEDFKGVLKEEGQFYKFEYVKIGVVVTSFLVWILSVLVFFSGFGNIQNSYSGPTPT